MIVRLTYRQILAEAMRIGGADMARNCCGTYGRDTAKLVAQSLGGPCAIVYDGGRDAHGWDEMPSIDVPDNPIGLLL